MHRRLATAFAALALAVGISAPAMAGSAAQANPAARSTNVQPPAGFAISHGGTLSTKSGSTVAPMSGGSGSGRLCQVRYDNTPMYDAPGGTQDWWMNSNEQFREHSVSGGWAWGHSTYSFPYDYWVRTNTYIC